MNVSDFLVDRLYQWGITRVYGYPGDGINGVMGALNRYCEKDSYRPVMKNLLHLWHVLLSIFDRSWFNFLIEKTKYRSPFYVE